MTETEIKRRNTIPIQTIVSPAVGRGGPGAGKTRNRHCQQNARSI